MPIGTSSERVALIRVGMDTGSAEQGAKNLANYFEEADKAAKKLEDGADNAGAGLEGLGESSQKLSVLIGQQGLAGDLMDVFEGLEGVSSMLGPVGTGAAVAAASFALLAAGAVEAQAAMHDLTRATVDAEEAAGRKLTPALKDAKDTMDGYDGAAQRTSRTITETLAPAFKVLSELFAGLKTDLASMLQSMIDFGGRAYDLTQEFDTTGHTGITLENEQGWNTLRRMTLAMVSGGTTEVNRAMGGNVAGLLYDRWRGVGRVEMTAGQLEGQIAEMVSAEMADIKYADAESMMPVYGPTPGQIDDTLAKRKAAEEAATEAAKGNAAAAQRLAEAQRLAAEQLMADALRDSPGAYSAWLAEQRQQARMQSWEAYTSGPTVSGSTGWITGEEWSTDVMSAEQRRGYLRMAAGQSATPDYSRISASLASGAQGFASVTGALSGGVGGLGSALSAAGPYGMAAAAGLAVLEDPKALLHGAREIQRLVEHLPERIGTILVDVAPKIIKMLPEVMADIATMMVVELPRAIADAIQRAWHDMTHRSDRERAQARRTPWYDRTWVRLAAGLATGGASELALAGVRAADNSRNARSSAPRRPDWGSMRLGPQAPVVLTAGVTDDSARAIKRKLAQQTRGGQR